MTMKKEASRDILVRIDERQIAFAKKQTLMSTDLKGIKDTYDKHLQGCQVQKQLDQHKKDHKWFVGIFITAVGAILAFLGFSK